MQLRNKRILVERQESFVAHISHASRKDTFHFELDRLPFQASNLLFLLNGPSVLLRISATLS